MYQGTYHRVLVFIPSGYFLACFRRQGPDIRVLSLYENHHRHHAALLILLAHFRGLVRKREARCAETHIFSVARADTEPTANTEQFETCTSRVQRTVKGIDNPKTNESSLLAHKPIPTDESLVSHSKPVQR